MDTSHQHTAASPPRCPFDMCDGSGFVVDEQTNTARDCTCRARRVASARARRLRERVPRRYMNLSWDRNPLALIAQDPNNRDSVRKVKDFCRNIESKLTNGDGLWIMGHTGTGKTTLGYMVAATAAHSERSVLSFNAAALLNRLRATFDSDSRETTDEITRALAEVDLLHIEDLRVVRPTEWVMEQIYLIVNARYEQQRSIIFTSDVDSDEGGPLIPNARELAKHIGARTFSRLMEMCGDPVVIAGEDKRLDFEVPGTRLPAAEPAADPWTALSRAASEPPSAEEISGAGAAPSFTLP